MANPVRGRRSHPKMAYCSWGEPASHTLRTEPDQGQKLKRSQRAGPPRRQCATQSACRLVPLRQHLAA